MKKQIFTFSIVAFLGYNSIAQNGNASTNANAQWRITGNSASTSDFIGTTNNQSLIFKTNNIQRGMFDTQGKLILDGGGEVIIHPGGLNRPILSNPIAQYMLKVGGSGHFDGELNSRQLFVQEYITFMKSLKGPRIDVDTIRMDSTRGIYGHTKVFGDVNIKQDLIVEGNTILKNNLVAEKGFTFDGLNGMKYIPAAGNTPAKLHFGTPFSPLTTYCAAAPNPGAINYFGGMIQLFDQTNINGTGLLNLQTWSGGSSIDASTGSQTTGGLLMNYFCHSPTFINTGWDIPNGIDGGRVYMGAEVEMQRSLKIGWNGTPSVIDANAAIEINQNTDNAKGVNVKTWNSSIKAFAIEYPDGANGFVVNGDGRTMIKTDADNAFDIVGKTSGAVNFRVKSSGFVYAREVNVMIGTYPDYVFKKNYELTPLEEVEKYIAKNHHLKGFERAEYYEKNGANLGEMVRLQQEKIEELTLYLIQLKKEIEELKK